jgi:ketosteroid isomerase-like protein
MASLEDEFAVRAVVTRYSDAIMCRDPAAAAALFARDGVLHAFAGEPVVGREAIEAALGARVSSRTPDPAETSFGFQMSREVGVSIDGDTAQGRWYYLEIGRGGEPGTGRLSMGTFNDRFVRTDEGWKIAHRRLTRFYVGDLEMPGKSFAREFETWTAKPS